MSLSVLTGAISGLSAVGLMLVGLVFLVPAALRLPFVLRRPGKGRFAKGAATFGAALLLGGALLFLASDLTTDYVSFRHALDSAAPVVSAVVFLLAALAGARGARRATSPQGSAGEAPSPAAADEAADRPARGNG